MLNSNHRSKNAHRIPKKCQALFGGPFGDYKFYCRKYTVFFGEYSLFAKNLLPGRALNTLRPMEIENLERSSIFRNFLKQEFMQRIRKNSRYSLRAYAKCLGASPSYVSQLLNSNKTISFERMEKFIEQLGYSPEKLNELLSNNQFVRHQQLRQDLFEVSSVWYYHAILELTHLKDFPGTIAWVANALHLSLSETKMAVETLVRLGLLKIEGNQWEDCFEFATINFEEQTTSEALRKYQVELLKLSRKAVEDIPAHERQHRSMIYAIDQELVPELHQSIREFILKTTQQLEQRSQQKDSVFALQVSSFPIFKESKNEDVK